MRRKRRAGYSKGWGREGERGLCSEEPDSRLCANRGEDTGVHEDTHTHTSRPDSTNAG